MAMIDHHHNGYTRQRTVMENGQPNLPLLILNLERTVMFTIMTMKAMSLSFIGMCLIHT